MKINARDLALALGAALLGGGCGSDSRDTPSPDPAPTLATTAARTADPTTSQTPSAAPAAPSAERSAVASSRPTRVTTAAPVGSVTGPKHACGAGKCGEGTCG